MKVGCLNCLYKDKDKLEYPCTECCHAYENKWTDALSIGTIVTSPYHEGKMIVTGVFVSGNKRMAHTMDSQCTPDVYAVEVLVPTGKVMSELRSIIAELED